jgi:hypothetical protein
VTLRAGVRAVCEVCLYSAGVYAGIMLAWHVAALALVVTVGPGAPALRFPILDQLRVFWLALASLPAFVAASARLRAWGGRVDAALPLQVGTGLFALALSYRFVALLILCGVLICHLRNSNVRRLAAWWMWGLALLACLAPVDVSLRSSAALRQPGLVPTAECQTVHRAAEEEQAGTLVCVPDSPLLYSEPRYMVVW